MQKSVWPMRVCWPVSGWHDMLFAPFGPWRLFTRAGEFLGTYHTPIEPDAPGVRLNFHVPGRVVPLQVPLDIDRETMCLVVDFEAIPQPSINALDAIPTFELPGNA